ncbi:MAG: hypothetical protein M1826_004785 [Phylliscum demangeonii]|nr:MAG: hypothetical protein M1826_004785 [Phylliscum demangeonii]
MASAATFINANNHVYNNQFSVGEHLENRMDPTQVSLLDHNPFDILGLNPHEIDFPDRDALCEAYTRACKHTRSFATSSTLTLPPSVQAGFAFLALTGPHREQARAFWRAHHRSTWNPHAPVDSVEAGRPIPGQEGASPEEAGLLMAAAVAAVEAGADKSRSVLLGPYHPPGCSERGYGDGATDGLGPVNLLFSNWYNGAGDRNSPTLPAVMLGSFRWPVPANAVVALLDRRGRYYRRIMPWTMAGKPLRSDSPVLGDDPNFAISCPPAYIDYLPRFRGRTETQVMAMVREELALLQRQVDALAPTGPEAV